MTKSKFLSRAEIIFKTKDGYSHLFTHVRRLPEDGEVLSRYTVENLYFQDLMMNSQMHKGSDHLYGFDVCYNSPYRVDLQDAEKMVKSLKTINGKLDKINKKYGYVQSWTDRVIRFLNVVKCEYIQFYNIPSNIGGNTIIDNATKYPVKDVKYILYNLESLTIKYYGRTGEKVASSSAIQ